VKIRFGEEHLRCFAAASLDFNPLHLSEDYARKTSSGERVIYGILGFLACLKGLSLLRGQVPSTIRIDFKAPLALDVEYTIASKQENSGGATVAIMDGSATAMRVQLQFCAGLPETTALPEFGVAPLAEARILRDADFQKGLSFRGSYAPGRRAYLELLELLEIDRGRWGDSLLIAALCTSYVTGMELPGESATYAGLRLRLQPGSPSPADFEISVQDYHPHFGMVRLKFSIAGASGIFAEGEISASARSSRVKIAATGVTNSSGRFAQKTAVVIGASRGLGSAMALDLIAEGAAVIGVYERSQDDAGDLLQASRGLSGSLVMERGDASDPDWCATLKNRVQTEFGGLDLLVCSAAPAVQPLRVEEACYERIRDYLSKGFALFTAPLTSLLETVVASNGCVLTISSKFVEDPPEIWPHYVALKAAVEGLIRSAAAGNPKVRFWIARPSKILTDMTNTPMGRLNAEEPQVVSRRILEHVFGEAADGVVHYCD
jgi:NAD(P)-dependent dehydrogenase (short-subunit alcohol dehydrogenase family)